MCLEPLHSNIPEATKPILAQASILLEVLNSRFPALPGRSAMALTPPKLEANLASILKTSFDSRPEAERSSLEAWLLTEGLYDVRDFALLSPDLETVPDAVLRPAGVAVTVGSSIAAKKAWSTCYDEHERDRGVARGVVTDKHEEDLIPVKIREDKICGFQTRHNLYLLGSRICAPNIFSKLIRQHCGQPKRLAVILLETVKSQATVHRLQQKLLALPTDGSAPKMIKDEATQISRFPQLWQTIRLVYEGICMATISEPDYCPLSVVHEFLDDLWPFIFNNYSGKDLLILLDAYQKTSQSFCDLVNGSQALPKQITLAECIRNKAAWHHFWPVSASSLPFKDGGKGERPSPAMSSTSPDAQHLQGEINRLKSLMGNMQDRRQGGPQGKGRQQGKGIPIGGKRPQGNQQPAGMRAMKKKSMKKRNW